MQKIWWPLAFAVATTACSNENSTTLGSYGGTTNGGGQVTIDPTSLGGSTGTAGTGGGTTSAGNGQLTIAVRDFKLFKAGDSTTVDDFENPPTSAAVGGNWDDKGIVTDQLGSDHKPVYKSSSTTLTTHGKASFDKWYNNVDGINLPQAVPITLTKRADGTYGYDSQTAGAPLSPGGGFFPIDDGGKYATKFGNQGKNHNFSFTVEIHTLFTYNGGETFHFSGDDDVFVYINNKLVINLGGIHAREVADVALDTLGLTKGTQYSLDFFSAERHVSQSNLLITTTLDLVVNPDVPIF